MKIQQLFEDENYRVVRRPRLIGVNHPFFSSFYVYNKNGEEAIKVANDEKMFLLTVLGEFVRCGLPGEKIKEIGFFHDFADAVARRGGPSWHVFFTEQSPIDAAHDYFDEVTTATKPLLVKSDFSKPSPEADCLDCLVGFAPAIDEMRATSDDTSIPNSMIAHTLDAFSKLDSSHQKSIKLAASTAQDLLYRRVAELSIFDGHTEAYVTQVIRYFFMQLSGHEIRTFYILDNTLRDDRYMLLLKIFDESGISVVTPRRDGKIWTVLESKIQARLNEIGHVAYVEPDAEVNFIEQAKQFARTSNSVGTFRNLAPTDAQTEILSM